MNSTLTGKHTTLALVLAACTVACSAAPEPNPARSEALKNYVFVSECSKWMECDGGGLLFSHPGGVQGCVDDDIAAMTSRRATALDLQTVFRQSNHEGELIGWIQEARDTASGIILNAGALTHSSIGILDALQAAELPVIEVHLSNIFRRDSFRHNSYVSLGANGVICGLGAHGYELAIDAMAAFLLKHNRG